MPFCLPHPAYWPGTWREWIVVLGLGLDIVGFAILVFDVVVSVRWLDAEMYDGRLRDTRAALQNEILRLEPSFRTNETRLGVPLPKELLLGQAPDWRDKYERLLKLREALQLADESISSFGTQKQVGIAQRPILIGTGVVLIVLGFFLQIIGQWPST